MDESLTLVVKGLSINNIVSTTSAPDTASPTDNSTASPYTDGAQNVPQSNVVPFDMVKRMFKEEVSDLAKGNDKILKELKDIKEAQEVGQRSIAEFKRDRENDRERYAQLQDQYMKLKQKNENTTTRLKDLNMEKYELARDLAKLETFRNSLQKELEILMERQSSDTEKYFSEIECKDREIESLRKRISELEGMISSGNEKHIEDSNKIHGLEEQIDALKEGKRESEKLKNELMKEVDDLMQHNENLTKGSQSNRYDIPFGRELTVQSISEAKSISDSPRLSRQPDMRRPRPVPKPFHTPVAYNTPRQQAFVGTGPPASSHNIIHRNGQKHTPREYR